jgi:mitochondrial fission protein ELM1
VLEPTNQPRNILPPVRIFVGTEPAHYRAERLLLWSIEQVRDKSRIYEIYLMKDLAGFHRRWWLTGFTNYRFAIPHFAGDVGRAIYNDVDQIYLSDPAELFDREMGEHGFLSIANESPAKRPIDSSVMLIDCARMASVWPLEAVQRGRKNALIRKALAVPGLWGRLEPEWNARDTEYVAGRSKVLHYTALHLQPWRPFPQRYVYQRNPVGHVWLDLERSADAAGYWHFSGGRPSKHYRELQLAVQADRSTAKAVVQFDPAQRELELGVLNGDACSGLITSLGLHSLESYRLTVRAAGAAGPPRTVTLKSGRTIAYEQATLPATPDSGRDLFDGVLCMDFLEFLPGEDVPWILDRLFRDVRHLVLAEVSLRRNETALGGRLDGHARPRRWWLEHFEAASARHPHVCWQLTLRDRGRFGREYVERHLGGRVVHVPPTVWVLTYEKPGHNTQSSGLAEAVGWPYEVKELRFRHLVARLHTWMQTPFGTLGASLVGLRRRDSATLAPPWPDLVIATGWRPGRVALWIRRQSGGHTRLIGLGRCAGQIADIFDVVATCRHFHLPLHPRRIETILPVNQVSDASLVKAARRWEGLLGSAPRPHIVLLVGGSNEFYRLDADAARHVGEGIQAAVRRIGGTVFAVTSRRTGAAATAALKAVLGDGNVHEWRRSQQENPYLGYLALADALVVTGDSESMLAEAAATDKPLYIYPVPERRFGLRRRLNQWAVTRTYARPLNRRGTIRPQQGLEYLLAKLIATGVLPPPRDLGALHRNLVDLGIARWFGEPLDLARHRPLREAASIACEIRRRMGFPDSEAQTDQAPTPIRRGGRVGRKGARQSASRSLVNRLSRRGLASDRD